MILPEMVDERIAKVLPRLLYAREIRCADPAMCQVIVAYEEMQGETAVPLRNGRAYVPVYLENAHVFFQDDHGNRYGSICYEEEPMMEVPELEEKTRKLYPSHEMLRLGQCRKILEKGNYTASEYCPVKGGYRRRMSWRSCSGDIWFRRSFPIIIGSRKAMPVMNIFWGSIRNYCAPMTGTRSWMR